MIEQVKEFVREFWESHGPLDKILDVGSRDINGSVRQILDGLKWKGNFTGLDMIDGTGVDIVMNAHDMGKKWKKPKFDLVTCVDTLEHDDRFWLTVQEMRKVVKPGGWMIITVPSLSHPFHAHPSDYYRFFDTTLKDVFFEGFEHVVTKSLYWSSGSSESKPDEVLGWGRKPL